MFTGTTLTVIHNGVYPYTDDLRTMESYRHNRTAVTQQTQSHSPLCVTAWTKELQSHPDIEFKEYLTQGMRYGFRIGFDPSQPLRTTRTNMPSARLHPNVVQEYLDHECHEGRVIGPLAISDHPEVHVSRFGVIPKKHQPNKWRLILDLSHPDRDSINDGIDKQLCSMKYASIDDAARIVHALGRGSLMAKIDIAHAYRIVPISPLDHHLLGMAWGDSLFIDTALPFGLRSAPKIFCAIADTLEWILFNKGVSTCLHYIDDFFTAGQAGSGDCQQNLGSIIATCDQLGIPLAKHKVEGPVTVMTFLGIEIDTDHMLLRLPTDKLDRLQALVTSWISRKAATKREMLSLIGQLSHACKVVIPGRSFLRQLIDLASSRHQLDHWIRLNESFRADLYWWHLFPRRWNGTSLISTHATSANTIVLVSDASGTWGCGAFYSRSWLQCRWTHSWADINIAAKEFVPILLGLGTWGHKWTGSHIILRCDNMAVVSIINNKKCSDKLLAHLLRCCHYLCAQFDITVTAQHIQGKLNTAADALSRNKVQLFHLSVPQADEQPSLAPQSLQEWVMNSTPDWLSPCWRHKLQN